MVKIWEGDTLLLRGPFQTAAEQFYVLKFHSDCEVLEASYLIRTQKVVRNCLMLISQGIWMKDVSGMALQLFFTCLCIFLCTGSITKPSAKTLISFGSYFCLWGLHGYVQICQGAMSSPTGTCPKILEVTEII